MEGALRSRLARGNDGKRSPRMKILVSQFRGDKEVSLTITRKRGSSVLQEREREVGGAEAGQELVYEHKGMTADQPKWIKN